MIGDSCYISGEALTEALADFKIAAEPIRSSIKKGLGSANPKAKGKAKAKARS